MAFLLKPQIQRIFFNVLQKEFPLFWTYISVGFLQFFVIVEIVGISHRYIILLVIEFSILCVTFLEFRYKAKTKNLRFILDITFFTFLLPVILIFVTLEFNILHVLLTALSISTFYKQIKLSNLCGFLFSHIRNLIILGSIMFVRKAPSRTPNLIAAFKRTNKYKINNNASSSGGAVKIWRITLS